jgi:hypothetical protein
MHRTIYVAHILHLARSEVPTQPGGGPWRGGYPGSYPTSGGTLLACWEVEDHLLHYYHPERARTHAKGRAAGLVPLI